MNECAAHKRHIPAALTLDWHHVLPRDWQRQWVPPGATVRDDSRYGPMWDDRGVFLCPTGHHNVHQCIVALMHGEPAVGAVNERFIAREALTRFTDAGGDLQLLRDAHCWGMM